MQIIEGIDYSYYRVKGEDQKIDPGFEIVCAIWGTTILRNWPFNREKLKNRKRRGVYGAYRVDKSGYEMAARLMECGDEVDAHFYAIDYEKYYLGKDSDGNKVYYELTAADIPRLKEYYYTIQNTGRKILVYASRYDFWLIEQYDPEFAAELQWWMAYYSNVVSYQIPLTIDNYGSYQSKIKKPFSEVVLIQRTIHASGADYGIHNVIYKDNSGNWLDEPKLGTVIQYVDGDVYNTTRTQTFDEWLGIAQEDQPEEEQPEEQEQTTMSSVIERHIAALEKTADRLEANTAALLTLAEAFKKNGTQTGDGEQEQPTEPPTESPEDPSTNWPQYVREMFGSWEAVKALSPVYVRSGQAGVWKASQKKATVWSNSDEYTQERSEESGGGVATKIIFENHDIPKDYYIGEMFPGYKDMIPNNVNEVPIGGIAADGERKIELIEYPGYVTRYSEAVLVGYFDAQGNYIAL